MNIYKDLLYSYKNGNYLVKIYADGTKVRFTLDDYFNAEFPESIDIKITNYCDNNCPMCHENSTVSGTHGKIDVPFLKTLKAGTELAIGGGNPFSHPELELFLIRMKNQGVICNVTINQVHFIKYKDYIQRLLDSKLVYGLGISMNDCLYCDEIISFCKKNDSCVIHLIAGIVNEDLFSKLYDNNLKILILGYKEFGRGVKYLSDKISKQIDFLKDNIMMVSSHFKVVSFDNLAIIQLKMQEKLSKEDFDTYYMGDDGSFTMYIDLVKEEFGYSSISTKRYKLLGDICEMFKIIKEECQSKNED